MKKTALFLAILSLAGVASVNAALVVDWTTTASASSNLNTASPTIGDGTAQSADNALLYSPTASAYTLTSVGDTITLTGSAVFTGTTPTAQGIRLGLYNVNGSVNTANWLGYLVTSSNTTTAGSVYELNSPNTAFNSTGAVGDTAAHTAPGAGNEDGDGTYTFNITLTLSGVNEITVTSSLIKSGVEYYGGTLVDTTPQLFTFNRVGFNTTGSHNADQVSFTNVDVTYTAVPEPGTFAMLLGGIGMLTMVRRRRA